MPSTPRTSPADRRPLWALAVVVVAATLGRLADGSAWLEVLASALFAVAPMMLLDWLRDRGTDRAAFAAVAGAAVAAVVTVLAGTAGLAGGEAVAIIVLLVLYAFGISRMRGEAGGRTTS